MSPKLLIALVSALGAGTVSTGAVVLFAQQVGEEFTWRDAVNYGLPTVLLFGLVVFLWRVILWLKTRVVEPLVESHRNLVDTLRVELPKQTAAVMEQTPILKKIMKINEETAPALKRLEEMGKESLDEAKAHNWWTESEGTGLTGPQRKQPSKKEE